MAKIQNVLYVSEFSAANSQLNYFSAAFSEHNDHCGTVIESRYRW
jgi:hypothetical protein